VPAIRAEGDIVKWAFVLKEDVDQITSLRIPDAYGLIKAARGEVFAIGTEGQTLHPISMCI